MDSPNFNGGRVLEPLRKSPMIVLSLEGNIAAYARALFIGFGLGLPHGEKITRYSTVHTCILVCYYMHVCVIAKGVCVIGDLSHQ